jgi:hypothetical protein
VTEHLNVPVYGDVADISEACQRIDGTEWDFHHPRIEIGEPAFLDHSATAQECACLTARLWFELNDYPDHSVLRGRRADVSASTNAIDFFAQIGRQLVALRPFSIKRLAGIVDWNSSKESCASINLGVSPSGQQSTRAEACQNRDRGYQSYDWGMSCPVHPNLLNDLSKLINARPE